MCGLAIGVALGSLSIIRHARTRPSRGGRSSGAREARYRALLHGWVRVRAHRRRVALSPSIRRVPCLIIQLRFPVPVLPTTSLSVAYGEGRWGTLLSKDSRWLGEAWNLNRL